MNESGGKYVSSDFLKVLLALKKNVMKDTNVADVCIVNKVDDSIYCAPVNNSNVTIVCDKLNNLNVSQNDIVVVLYMNSDFRQNLKRFKQNQPLMNVNSEQMHSLNYGVIIGIIYKKEN